MGNKVSRALPPLCLQQFPVLLPDTLFFISVHPILFPPGKRTARRAPPSLQHTPRWAMGAAKAQSCPCPSLRLLLQAGVGGSPFLLQGECVPWDGVYPSSSLVFAASSLSISVAASSAICWICGKTVQIRVLCEVMPQFKGKGVAKSPFRTKLKVPIKPQ